MNQPQAQRQPEHQVIADGEVIYEGDDWQLAFLEAGKHPEYTTIIHIENGEPGAVLGPVQPSQNMHL
ncbi:MAG TPA: hypothetical protein VHL10_02970 [Nitrososphaera sp.]|nr:hypothetical protein [Nitrososphaera sp.]